MLYKLEARPRTLTVGRLFNLGSWERMLSPTATDVSEPVTALRGFQFPPVSAGGIMSLHGPIFTVNLNNRTSAKHDSTAVSENVCRSRSRSGTIRVTLILATLTLEPVTQGIKLEGAEFFHHMPKGCRALYNPAKTFRYPAPVT